MPSPLSTCRQGGSAALLETSGETINAVMKNDPTYLAWFVDQGKGQDDLIEEIKTHTRFPLAWAAYVEKQAAAMPKARREEKEWQEGRFSQQTIDEVFICFFGGQSSNRCRACRTETWPCSDSAPCSRHPRA